MTKRRFSQPAASNPASRTRLLRVIGRLNVGGPAIQAITLTHLLNARGYDTTLVRGVEGPREGSMDYLAARYGVEALRIPTLRRSLGLHDLAAVFALTRLLRGTRFDVLHTHAAKGGTVGRVGSLLAGPRRRPRVTVHTFHGHVLSDYFSGPKTAFFKAVERWLARRTTLLIAVSEEVKQDLIRLGIAPPQRIVVVPLGFDLGPFALVPLLARDAVARSRSRLGLRADERVVTLIARLVPIKRVDRFLRVAAHLGDVPDARFLIVGDGELADELMASPAAIALGDRLVWAGLQQDVPAVVSASDVVVLTSDNEGTPVSLIEAQAAGVPVVSTDVGGVSAVVRDRETGRLVARDDELGFAQAVREILADDELAARFSDRGRQHVLSRFDVQRLVDDLDQLYRRLLTPGDVSSDGGG